MNLSSEDPIVYKVKKFLKVWESNYVSIHNKEPQKQDIPDDLKVLYKVYKRIKEEAINDVVRKKVEELMVDLNDVYNIIGMLKAEKEAKTDSISETVRFNPVNQKRKSLGPTITRADSTPEDLQVESAKVVEEKAVEELINEAVDGIMIQLKSDAPVTLLPKVQVEAVVEQPKDLTVQQTAELNLENAVLSKRVPMNTILQCRVQRSRKIMPVYSIKNECDGRELCRVKKMVKGYKIFSLKNGEESLDYIIEQNKETYTTKNIDGVVMLVVMLESSVPRSVSISIHEGSNVKKYNNRQPKWNVDSETYTLNFEGRVTEPSVKNFVFADDNNANVLLFGRTGKSDFIMDCRFPFQPDQAVCAMISVFDAVDSQ